VDLETQLYRSEEDLTGGPYSSFPDGTAGLVEDDDSSALPPGLDVAEIYRVHFTYVWRILARFGISLEERDDAAQEVFVVAHRRAPEFDAQLASPKTWLFGIARRIAARLHRTRGRRDRRHAAYRDVIATLPPTDEANSHDARILLDGFLSTVDPVSTQIFILAEFEGMTHPEIGAVLDMKTNTVSSRLRRCRSAFRGMLDSSNLSQRLQSAVQEEGRHTPPGAAAAQRRVSALIMPLLMPPSLPAIASHSTSGGLLSSSAIPGSSAGATKVAAAVVTTGKAGWTGQLLIFATTVTLGTAGLAGIKTGLAHHDEPLPTSTRMPSGPPVATESRPSPGSHRAPIESLLRVDAARVQAQRSQSPSTPTSKILPAVHRASRATPLAEPNHAPSISSEIRCLREASVALQAGATTKALALIDRHRSEYGGAGALAQEIAALESRILCKLGRSDDASRVAENLAERFPGSPLAQPSSLRCTP